MGEMHAKVTGIKLEGMMGLIILVISVCLPGWSTIIAGVLAGGDNLMPGVVIGVLQFLTAWLLIGWLWSIFVGFKIYSNSK
jgi:hypothetical protein